MQWEIENNTTSEKYESVSFLREGMMLYATVRELKWWAVRCDLEPPFEAQLITKDNKVIKLGLFYDVEEGKAAINELVERLYK